MLKKFLKRYKLTTAISGLRLTIPVDAVKVLGWKVTDYVELEITDDKKLVVRKISC